MFEHPMKPHTAARALPWAIVTLALCAGCASYDEGAAVADGLNLSGDWTLQPHDPYPVPGELVRCWSGPAGARLVLYRNLPVPKASPQSLAEELANRLRNLPAASQVQAATETQRGQQLARVEAVAPGDGSSFAPSSLGAPQYQGKPLVPTRFVGLGLARAGAVYWLACYYPDSEHAKLGPQVDEVVRGWTIPGYRAS